MINNTSNGFHLRTIYTKLNFYNFGSIKGKNNKQYNLRTHTA